MEKNYLIAVILSIIIITAGFFVQIYFFPQDLALLENDEALKTASTQASKTETLSSAAPVFSSSTVAPVIESEEQIPYEKIEWETNQFKIGFSNRGGVITSLQLKNHQENGKYVEMLYKGTEEQNAFNILWGGPDAEPIIENFHYTKVNDETLEFHRTFIDSDGNPFVLRKTYIFKPNDYLMELDIAIENSINVEPAINNKGYAYTLELGPQIGPSFAKLDGRYIYRNYYTFYENKAKKVKIKDSSAVIDDSVKWAGIAGKYFTVIGIPEKTQYEIGFNEYSKENLIQSSVMTFSRPVIKGYSKAVDIYRFYIGPRDIKTLSVYDNSEDNGFGCRNLELSKIANKSPILGWLERILEFILDLFYKIVNNYGVAIILVTIFIKAVMFPFSRKFDKSTSNMQKIAPQIEELKIKYKDKPETLNKEITTLYKKEGINPLGAFLPILLQMPIFIAMYGLFDKCFDLRGAVFIPGWIDDLSVPESIYTFHNFSLPIIGWDSIRILPILFVLSQYLNGKVVQSGNSGGAEQMMLNNLMPLIFCIMLYDAPSGLLIYWIVSNIITTIQQVVINKFKIIKKMT